MKSVPTFTATIYVGFRVGRTNEPAKAIHSIDEARDVAQAYCDEVGLCVTVTPTTFVYTLGSEPGVIVGLMNYPRFPSEPAAIRAHALALAERLRVRLEQFRVSVVFPNETVMLGENEGG
jgi:Fe-S-cluster-containing hydrogenase component 2